MQLAISQTSPLKALMKLQSARQLKLVKILDSLKYYTSMGKKKQEPLVTIIVHTGTL